MTISNWNIEIRIRIREISKEIYFELIMRYQYDVIILNLPFNESLRNIRKS